MLFTKYRKRFSYPIAIGLIILGALLVISSIRPVLSQSPLLVDPLFNDSTDSADLRANNATAQDWYESRGGFSGGNSSLVTLDTSNVGGNTGKKAGLKNYGQSQNAYVTQDFVSPQSGTFSVVFDIYVDRIEDNANYDRAGHVYIGDDHISTNAPTGTSDERFVLMAFYDSTPGDTGNDLEIRAREQNTPAQSWLTTSAWTQVASGLNYDTWIRVEIILNFTGGTYDVYVDGALEGDDISKYEDFDSSNVTHISFALDSDARGDFYVDNVYSPTPRIMIVGSTSEARVGQSYTVYINVTDVVDLYGWEFQLDYNQSILDLTYNGTVSGGLKTPTQTWKDSTNETTGHLWWAVSTTYPNTTGISYTAHAIFEIQFTAIAKGTSNIDLSYTILSDSGANAITHTVVNGSITVINSAPTIDTFTPVDTTPDVDEGDSLAFTHTSSDPDDDPLSYSWLLDDVEQATTQNWTYSPGYNDAGSHNVTLVVSDGSLTDSQQWDVTVNDVNRAPVASNLAITPSSPLTTDDLVGSYDYSDDDGDPESGSEIRWYKDDVLQTALNDTLTVSSGNTSIGEVWYFTVRPSDGTDFGSLQTSPSVTVQILDLTVTGIEILNKHANETWTHSIYANDTYVNASAYYYPVNVTISNTGTLNANNFKVKLEVYYDTTLETSAEKTGISLSASSTMKLTFMTLFHPNKTGDAGRYRLKATVDSGSDVTEDNEGNNVLTKNDFLVTILGDVNGDKIVNILDAVVLALAWDGEPGEPQWNVAADLDHNDIVNILDGVRTSLNWGKTW